MDLLPEFISSKYFIYDPQYEFLTLGTYSTLRYVRLGNVSVGLNRVKTFALQSKEGFNE